MVVTIKRRKHAEKYDEKKVYGSVYSAAMSSHYQESESEQLAQRVMEEITSWIARDCEHVSSEQIRKKIWEVLCAKDRKDVALMYNHHLDVC